MNFSFRAENARNSRISIGLERIATQISQDVNHFILSSLYGLLLTENLFTANDVVSEQDFDEFLGNQIFEVAYPGALGFGFIERVRRDEADAYAAAQVELSRPLFSIQALSAFSASDLYIVKFIFPERDNIGIEGLDFGSERVRLAALTQAVDTGEPTLTSLITLVQSAGISMFLPIYERDSSLNNVAERRAALIGLLYAPISLAELISQSTAAHPSVKLQLLLSTSDDTEVEIFSDTRDDTTGRSESSFYHDVLINFGGQQLKVRVGATPAYEAEFPNVGQWAIFWFVMLASAYVSFALRKRSVLLERAQRTSSEKTLELWQEKSFWYNFAALSEDWYWETNADYIFIRSEDFPAHNASPVFEKLLGQNLRKLLKDSAGRLEEAIKRPLQLLDEHQPLHTAEISLILEGSIFVLEIAALPIFNSAGHFSGYRGTARDVTSRAATAALTADLASKLTLATAAGDIGVFEYDPRSNEIIWSDITYTLYGLDPSQSRIDYQTWRSCLHPDDAESLLDQIGNVLSGQSAPETRYRIIKPNGEVRFLKSYSVTIFDADGKPVKLIGINQDVTDATLLRIKLEDSEAMLRSIVAAVPDGLITFDSKGLVKSINTAAKEMFQITDAEIIDQNMSSIIADFRKDHELELIRTLHGEQSSRKVQRLEVTGVQKDGHKIAVELSINELGLERQSLFVAILRDISLRKLDETAMALARLQAEAASRAKTEFMSNMSHEIRTPLNAIMGLTYLLEKENLDLKSHETVRKIRSAGTLLLSTISDILDISKIEAGFMQIEKIPFDLAEVIESVRDNIQGFVGEKNIKISSSLHIESVQFIIGDPTRLQQVLMNLGSNAVKFTQAGSIKLTVDLLRNADDIEYLRFSVADTGIGIDEEMLDTIFQPFTQAESSITRRFGGTGLGLSICSQLVALMGGKIGVNSIQGHGSEFWFSLPLERYGISLDSSLNNESLRTLAAEKRTDAKQIGTLGELRVLVVDDSDINREVAQRILINYGATVTVAEDGQQAIEWLVKNPKKVDVVLMDLQMPVLDGLEATRRLRKMPEFYNLPIVALTSGVFQSQKDEALNAGMNDFVSKPFDVAVLISLISRLHRKTMSSSVAPEDASLVAPSNLRVASEVMDIRKGLELWSDMTTYQVFLKRFASSYSDAAERISANLASGDLSSAAALAHKVSGTAASMALPDTHHTAQQLEKAIRTSDATEPAMSEFCKALKAALAEIDRYLGLEEENHK